MTTWQNKFRALLNRGAERAFPVELPRRVLRELGARLRRPRLTISGAALCRAVAHSGNLSEAVVHADAGAIRIEASTADGTPLSFTIHPERWRFAPRGAKEVVFRIEPAESAENAAVRSVVGALAGLIAQALWPLSGRPGLVDPGAAPVDREPNGGLRVDLRSVPFVRGLESSPMGLLLDLLDLTGLRAHNGQLILEVQLAGLLRP